jgi:hypothetical protein
MTTMSASLPLTPVSSNDGSLNLGKSQATYARSYPETPNIPEANAPIIPLISSVFPYHATQVASMALILEIVTPPDHVLQGFVVDHPGSGRTVYVHLPPPHASAQVRPETLSANFSDVLRPHDPKRTVPSPQPPSAPGQALDMRDSLTALLDLASDNLEATSLVLVLDKDERDPDRLGELLHSLMYMGGQVVRPGGLEGGWDWDQTQWVLVGIEL